MSDEKKIIVPNKDELELLIPKELELEKASKVDFSLDELFPLPEELNGKSALTVLYLVNLFLSQLSRVWKSRGRLTNNRICCKVVVCSRSSSRKNRIL